MLLNVLMVVCVQVIGAKIVVLTPEAAARYKRQFTLGGANPLGGTILGSMQGARGGFSTSDRDLGAVNPTDFGQPHTTGVEAEDLAAYADLLKQQQERATQAQDPIAQLPAQLREYGYSDEQIREILAQLLLSGALAPEPAGKPFPVQNGNENTPSQASGATTSLTNQELDALLAQIGENGFPTGGQGGPVNQVIDIQPLNIKWPSCPSVITELPRGKQVGRPRQYETQLICPLPVDRTTPSPPIILVVPPPEATTVPPRSTRFPPGSGGSGRPVTIPPRQTVDNSRFINKGNQSPQFVRGAGGTLEAWERLGSHIDTDPKENERTSKRCTDKRGTLHCTNLVARNPAACTTFFSEMKTQCRKTCVFCKE